MSGRDPSGSSPRRGSGRRKRTQPRRIAPPPGTGSESIEELGASETAVNWNQINQAGLSSLRDILDQSDQTQAGPSSPAPQSPTFSQPHQVCVDVSVEEEPEPESESPVPNPGAGATNAAQSHPENSTDADGRVQSQANPVGVEPARRNQIEPGEPEASKGV